MMSDQNESIPNDFVFEDFDDFIEPAAAAAQPLTASQRRWVLAESGVAEQTLRNWLDGRAREASALRIEAALRKLASQEPPPAPIVDGRLRSLSRHEFEREAMDRLNRYVYEAIKNNPGGSTARILAVVGTGDNDVSAAEHDRRQHVRRAGSRGTSGLYSSAAMLASLGYLESGGIIEDRGDGRFRARSWHLGKTPFQD